MGWFNKKKNAVVIPPCNHKYRDFPWYITAELTTNRDPRNNEWKAQIKEPYVCVKCGHRRDEVLCTGSGSGANSAKDLYNKVEWYKEIYAGKVMNRAEVEDMVADMRLVDREFLAIVDGMMTPKINIPS